MKKISKRIVFFGNERLATGVNTTTPVLLGLIKAGYDIAAVISNYTTGKSRNTRDLEIKKLAETYKIPLFLPDKPIDISKQISDYGAEAAVLVAYGKIVPQKIIDLFPRGIINIHPSLLPKHRGPTPIESVIINGDSKTGVSIMRLTKDMDSGPVFGQVKLKIRGKESKQDLANKLLDIGKAMILDLLPGILDDSVTASLQDGSLATYDKLITKEDGVINWQKSAVQLEREIRAYLGWPGSRTAIAGKEVIITKAHVGKKHETQDRKQINEIIVARDKQMLAQTGDGTLIIDGLKPAGKKEISGEEFIRGYLRQ